MALSNYGITVCAPCSTNSTNTTDPFEAYVSIISSHCLFLAATIIRLKFGIINNGDVSLLFWDTWITSGPQCFIKNILGSSVLQTIRLFESGTGKAALAFVY